MTAGSPVGHSATIARLNALAEAADAKTANLKTLAAHIGDGAEGISNAKDSWQLDAIRARGASLNGLVYVVDDQLASLDEMMGEIRAIASRLHDQVQA